MFKTVFSTLSAAALGMASPAMASDPNDFDLNNITQADIDEDMQEAKVILMTPYQSQVFSYLMILKIADEAALAEPNVSDLNVRGLQYIERELGMDLNVSENMPLERIGMLLVNLPNLAAQYGHGEADLSKAIEGAIDDISNHFDPHTDYLNTDQIKEMQNMMNNQIVGIGIQMRKDIDPRELETYSQNSEEAEALKGNIRIDRILEDGPAGRAGLRRGDIITHVDGTPILEKSTNEIVDLVTGAAGSDVNLTVERDGQVPFNVTITRASVTFPMVESRIIESENIGYVSLSHFGNGAAAQLREGIERLKSENPGLKGFVLDLRFNPGGYLHEAIQIADMFLEDGAILHEQGKVRTTTTRATPGDILNGAPLVVLTNTYSASASELISGSLQDNNRARVVGNQTFGKGTVQSGTPLPNGGYLNVTIAHYMTASGDSIQGTGVTPNMRVDGPDGKRPPRVSEADIENFIPNPETGVDETETDTICYPVVDIYADFQGTADYKAAGTPLDYELSCAIDAFDGHDSPFTDTKPAPKVGEMIFIPPMG